MYGGFNLIFFPVFYKTGRSEGKAFLWGRRVYVSLYHRRGIARTVYPLAGSARILTRWRKAQQLRQLPVLFAGIVLWAAFTLLSAKISAERFEKVDL